MLLMELLDWSCIVAALECSLDGSSSRIPQCAALGPFVYSECSGPSVWKGCYPDARGCEQSPVNIVARCASVLMPSEPLKWCRYFQEPISMNLANDGNTGR